MPSHTVENYVKQLYLEQEAAGQCRVAMGRLAAAMGVVPGTATTMIKTLADAGLVAYQPRGGVHLSPAGTQLALHVLRRHRLVELFLVRVLGLDWVEVHDEAEELEHVISEKVLDRIDALLGRPAADPHGDPIPSPKGRLPKDAPANLADAPLATPLTVARVLDQTPAFLKFVRSSGLTPGAELTIAARSLPAGSVEIHPAQTPPLTLSTAVAAKFLVTLTPASAHKKRPPARRRSP